MTDPLTLRLYQQNLVHELRRAYADGRRHPILVLPTGGGKTVIAAGLALASQGKGSSMWFACHRDFLIEQTHQTFDAFGVPHGFLAAGRPVGMHPTMVVGVDTLKARLGRIAQRPQIMVWDECHHTQAAGWQNVWEWCGPQCFHIGLTASPQRLDGKGLGAASGRPGFQALIMGPTVAQLMAWGNLSQYRAWASLTPDLKGVRVTAGDFNLRDLGERVTQSVITGDVVDTYRLRANGRRAIYFCVSIEYSRNLAAAFVRAGIPAQHIDGECSTEERIAAAKRFARGEVMVLTNCALLGEGFDLAAQAGMPVTVEAVGLVRPTQSMALHLQQMGRALRPKADPAIILDHAGNIERHGLPDTPRTWSLEGRKKKVKEPAQVKTCPHCLAANPIHVKACMECGHAFVPKARNGPDHVEGELQEVTLNGFRRPVTGHQRLELIRSCKSYSDFVKVGNSLGYKPGWAWHRWREYQGRIHGRTR